MQKPLLLIGYGRMGSAMLKGWLDCGISADTITVVEPNNNAAKVIHNQLNVATVSSVDELLPSYNPATIVIAVKPQVMDKMLASYQRFVAPNTVFLSIAAGKTLAYFEKTLGLDAAIIRAMPNTPATVMRAVTVTTQNKNVTPQQRQNGKQLLEAIGDVFEIDDESQMDAVTALSGGGPAYVFLLVETLTKAGIKAGLPENLAADLARLTVSGSGEMLRQSDEHPSILRQNVTSPGGTTAEALAVLMADDGWQPLMNDAIKNAANRSRELAE